MVASNLLLHRALELPSLERARLAYALLESLEAEDEIEGAWGAEVSNRLDSLRSGSAALVASEDLFRSFEA